MNLGRGQAVIHKHAPAGVALPERPAVSAAAVLGSKYRANIVIERAGGHISTVLVPNGRVRKVGAAQDADHHLHIWEGGPPTCQLFESLQRCQNAKLSSSKCRFSSDAGR